MALPLSHNRTPTSCQDEEDLMENYAPIESNASKDVTKEKTFDLQPVSPFSSGEGLPYAPEGWPNPGDLWGWKVGRRTNKAGYFYDRYLSLPVSLQGSSRKTGSFYSKPDVMRYLESNFPNMKSEEFFALFSWQVPSAKQTPAKAVQSLPITPPVNSPETREDATKEIGTRKKLKRKTQICSHPTRKSSRLVHVRPHLTPGEDANNVIDLCHLNEESRIDATENLQDIFNSEEGSGMQPAEEKNPNGTFIENFNDYFDTLEDILVMPHTETSSDHVALATTLDNEIMECCKKKLSSFLAVDFLSLVSGNDVVEVATLASQVCKDPTLSVDQLVKLKLVEQIPLVSEAFLEAKGNVEEAEKLLADLEAMKLKVPSVRNEYNELKNKVSQKEAEMVKNTLAIQEIDDQIRQFESKRNEISSALETMQKSKVELTSRLTEVANSIPTLVHEIQLGLSEKSKWELKKANNAKRAAEIEEKFLTLRGNDVLNLQPVAPEVSGEGLPYAPENWPEVGDVWGWRTGRRIVSNGTHFQDRYLYLPNRLIQALKQKENPGSGSIRKQHIFASKLAVERYIKANFPGADLNAFFASFSWKIPALPSTSINGNGVPIAAVPLQQIPQEVSDSDCGDVFGCKASNKKCTSLVLEEVEKYSPAMPCDICCSEPGFCRDCCCILCCQTVSSAYGGYSHIKCQVKVGVEICGHVAHMECALRCLLAGKVGGNIGLDAQYHCRRCDGRTDMISHVNNLLQTCKAADLDDEIRNKILNLGACLLRGSQKPIAKELLSRIELAISKLKCGTNLEDIWKEDGSLIVHSADHGNDVMEVTVNDGSFDVRTGLESYNGLPHSLKLEAEVDQVLLALRKSQEIEYKVAEETLQAQKTFLQNLYQQLDCEKNDLASQTSSGLDVSFSAAVRERKKQIRREVTKFEVMKKVANGYGSISPDIIKEHFGLN
ncbi:Protein OBERON 1, partial [Mucuna pruriens]